MAGQTKIAATTEEECLQQSHSQSQAEQDEDRKYNDRMIVVMPEIEWIEDLDRREIRLRGNQ